MLLLLGNLVWPGPYLGEAPLSAKYRRLNFRVSAVCQVSEVGFPLWLAALLAGIGAQIIAPFYEFWLVQA
jgi:hypothetical protein